MSEMKSKIQILLLIFFCLSTASNAKETEGVWATDCANKNSQIIRSTASGLFLQRLPESLRSQPSTALNPNDLKIVNNDTIMYKGIRYRHCQKLQVAQNNPVSKEQIKENLQGKWKFSYQTLDGKKTTLKNRKLDLPELHFLNDKEATLTLNNEVTPVKYRIDDDQVLLELNKLKSYKVFLVDQKKLQLTFEMNPAEGVFFYYKLNK